MICFQVHWLVTGSNKNQTPPGCFDMILIDHFFFFRHYMHGVPLIFVAAGLAFAIILLVMLERKHNKSSKDQQQSVGNGNSALKQNDSTLDHKVQNDCAKKIKANPEENQEHVNTAHGMDNEEAPNGLNENTGYQGHINRGLITDYASEDEPYKTKL